MDENPRSGFGDRRAKAETIGEMVRRSARQMSRCESRLMRGGQDKSLLLRFFRIVLNIFRDYFSEKSSSHRQIPLEVGICGLAMHTNP